MIRIQYTTIRQGKAQRYLTAFNFLGKIQICFWKWHLRAETWCKVQSFYHSYIKYHYNVPCISNNNRENNMIITISWIIHQGLELWTVYPKIKDKSEWGTFFSFWLQQFWVTFHASMYIKVGLFWVKCLWVFWNQVKFKCRNLCRP